MYHVHDPKHVKAIARFRMGCSWFNIERMRYGTQRAARSARTCPLCDGQAREDERHVFECPAYELLRAQFVNVALAIASTESDQVVYARMSQVDCRAWQTFAIFLHKARVLREQKMEVPNGVLDADMIENADD